MAFGLDLGNLLVHLRGDSTHFNRMMSNAEKRMRAVSDRSTALGRTMTMRVTLPLLALAAAIAKIGISMESAFIGVRKTVDATETEFAALQKGFEEMSLRIPLSIENLYGLGEAAGQLGIQTENILRFSETMAQLGVTTNISAQEAAMSLARLANITQMPQDQFDRLGATIVDLGNNFATTEAEIVQMSLRLASAGKIAGMAESEILAIGTALTSVGVQAQVGGTAIQKVLIGMVRAVAEGNKELEVFAAVAGKTAEEFAEAFERDAAEAFVLFVEGLQRSGKSAFALLEKLGLADQRLIRALLSLAGGNDLLRKSVELGNKAWQENTALVKEAELRFGSTASQLRLFWNEVRLTAASFKNTLMPPILNFLNNYVKPLLRYLRELNDEQKRSILIYAGVAIAIGPVLLITGLLLKTFILIIAKTKVLIGLFAGLGTAMAAPYLPILFLISAAYILRATWIQNLGGIRDAMEKWFNNFKEGFDWLMGPVSEFLAWFAKSFMTTFDYITVNFQDFISDLAGTLAGTVSWIKKVKDGIIDAWSAPTFYQMIDDFKRGFKEGGEAFAITFVGAKEKTDAAFEAFKKSIISGYESVGVVLSEINAVVGDDFKEVFGMVKKQIAEDMRSILDLVLSAQKEMKDAMSGAGMADVVDFAEKWLMEGVETFGKAIEDAADKGADAVKSFKEKAAGYLQSWADEALQTVDGVFTNMAEVVGSALTGISEELTDLVLKGKADFNSLAHSILRDLTQMIIKAQMAKALMSFFGMGLTPVEVPSPVYMVEAPTGHKGGIVGQMSASRYVPASVFEGASRYHNGLALDEVPTILQKGEKVLSKDDVAQMDGGRGDTYNVYISAIDKRGVYEFFNENQNLVASSIQGARRGNHPLRRM